MSDPTGGKVDVILIATGSEVSVAIEAQDILAKDGIGVRVVSMPSWELFEKQSKEYQDAVLPPSVTARLSIEAGVALGWQKYVGTQGVTISIERFGASAPYQTIMQHLGFTAANIVEKVHSMFKGM